MWCHLNISGFIFSSSILVVLFIIYPSSAFPFSFTTDTIPGSFAPIHQEELFFQVVESIIEESEYEEDFSPLLEDLELLKQHPINLNKASADELRRLFFLNDLQIYNLMQHIDKFGYLINIYELQSIDGFDIQTIRLLQPYISLGGLTTRRHLSFDNIVREGSSQFLLRYQQLFEQQLGYSPIEPEELMLSPNSRYLGSPVRLYSRYRFTYYQNISLGFTAEKDPGEEFFKGSQKRGFDFYSGHLFIHDLGRLHTLAIGDFQVQFGQGITFWSGLSFGKSSNIASLKKSATGIRPYTSVDENSFLRGVATAIRLGQIEFSTFFSSKNHDARVIEIDSASGRVLVIANLQQTGLHRTPGELKNRRSVRENILGANLTYRSRNLSAGLTTCHTWLNAGVQRGLSFYNQFEWNDNQHSNIGIDYNYLIRNVSFFGEAAISNNGGFAIINGILMSPDPGLSLSLSHRSFNPAYHSWRSASIGENTRTANEKGIIMGINLRLAEAWNFYAYADHFSFPWMKYQTYMPSRGFEYLAQLNYKPSRKIEIYARYKLKNKPLNAFNTTNPIPEIDDVIRKNYRLNFAYQVTQSISFRNRIELIDYNSGIQKEKGYMVYHDIIYRRVGKPFSATFRYALFDTDGFQSRIYAFENDVLYAFSFPFYYEQGSRVYLLTRYSGLQNLDIYARLAQTVFTNRNIIGSGLDEIQGNTRTEIKIQFRIRF